MSRFSSVILSSAALAADTGFAWLHASASNGYKLRRVTLGCIAGATVPTSQQLLVSVFRATNAGTTPVAGTANKLDPNSGAAGSTVATGFATPPTIAAAPSWYIPFNSQAGVDMPWEQLEEWVCATGTTNGLAFINEDNALPASHKLSLTIEWEE